MDTFEKKWFVIVNPTSGKGKAKNNWTIIKDELINQGFNFEFGITNRPNHSEEIALEAIKSGVRDFIIVGGDGTIHNVINTVMTQKEVKPSSIKIGIIASGTGNDWFKSYSLSKTISDAVNVIRYGITKQQDIGKITIAKTNESRYFIGSAATGFGAYIASKINNLKFLGEWAYYVSILFSLKGLKNYPHSISSKKTHIKCKSIMLFIGICEFTAGGMRLTKNPNPRDGLFDFSIAKNFNVIDLIKNASSFHNGEFANYKKVETFKSNSVSVTFDSKKIPLVQADGEIIGKGDFTCEIIPNAITFYV